MLKLKELILFFFRNKMNQNELSSIQSRIFCLHFASEVAFGITIVQLLH